MTLMKFTVTLGAALILWGAPVTSQAKVQRIEIVASRFSYSPSEITLEKGKPVVLVFRSTDVTHGFKFKEMHVQCDIKKGKETEVKFTPLEVGHFVAKCAHFCGKGHGSMKLRIDIVE
jgi:cytochrome c oxidase subunit 2